MSTNKLYINSVNIGTIHLSYFLFNIITIMVLNNVYMFTSTILVKSMFQSTNSTPAKPILHYYLKQLHHI